jgi:hypothetical protein
MMSGSFVAIMLDKRFARFKMEAVRLSYSVSMQNR